MGRSREAITYHRGFSAPLQPFPAKRATGEQETPYHYHIGSKVR